MEVETKEIKINVPEGYEIDKENSTFECIKFKPIQSRFSDYDCTYSIEGWGIAYDTALYRSPQKNSKFTKNTFATEKQAKSALAMAQISQIMANDERFGGVVTDDEWYDSSICKYSISRERTHLKFVMYQNLYEFLAFHTEEQRDLFFKENEQLVKDYLMIE